MSFLDISTLPGVLCWILLVLLLVTIAEIVAVKDAQRKEEVNKLKGELYELYNSLASKETTSPTSKTKSESMQEKKQRAASVIELVSSALAASPGALLQTNTEKLMAAQEILQKNFQIDINDLFVTARISGESGLVSLVRVNFPTEVSKHMTRAISNLIREVNLGEELRYDPDEMASLLVGALSITRSGANFRASFASALEQFSSEYQCL